MELKPFFSLGSPKAFTLVELILAVSLASVIFLGASAAYIAGTRNLVNTQTNTPQLGLYIALENMTRKVALANLVEVTSASGGAIPLGNPGPQLKFRWHYDLGGNAITASPYSNANDTWVKYLIAKDGGGVTRLYGRAATCCDNTGAETSNVTNADPEVFTGLTLDNAQSSFTLLDNRTVRITLAALLNTTPPKTIVVTRDTQANAIPN